MKKRTSFSIKHRAVGKDMGVAIVLGSTHALNESDIRGFVLRHMADFKVPKMVMFLDQMPRDSIDKIDRMSPAARLDRGYREAWSSTLPTNQCERTT